jgi:hypothetical protein
MGEPPGDAPKPPTGLLKCTRDAWYRFWHSRAAAQVDVELHLTALEDWIRHRDEWERSYRVFRKTMLVRGSTGQVRLNPLAQRLQELRGIIEKYEQKFGLTPLDTLRLGFDPLPRVIERPPPEDVPPEDRRDPRYVLRAVQ